MRATVCLVALLLLCVGASWTQDLVFSCPMDPEVRSNSAGVCSRCGMKLVAGVPDPIAFHMDLNVTPRAPKTGDIAKLEFLVHDPWKDKPVTNFQVVHEKLFHMFVVSQDLQFFLHNHPTLRPDGVFEYNLIFPKPGMYQILGDFYPDGATPQLLPKTVIVPGEPPPPVSLTRDYSPKNTENMKVELETDPPAPIAGMKTILNFKVSPADGFEKLLGAWGHMLTASDDLVDLTHSHPFIADGGPKVQFNAVFARARTYRIWVQFQRNGVVNTAQFDIPVEELK